MLDISRIFAVISNPLDLVKSWVIFSRYRFSSWFFFFGWFIYCLIFFEGFEFVGFVFGEYFLCSGIIFFCLYEFKGCSFDLSCFWVLESFYFFRVGFLGFSLVVVLVELGVEVSVELMEIGTFGFGSVEVVPAVWF